MTNWITSNTKNPQASPAKANCGNSALFIGHGTAASHTCKASFRLKLQANNFYKYISTAPTKQSATVVVVTGAKTGVAVASGTAWRSI
jgi:hypothetical protein